MSLSVATNINIDTLKNLDANKTYFLSSKTGEVKEASLWMRFKCAIGVQSARQKVANLIDAVRTALLDAAGKTGGDATLDTNINSVKRTEMVKGSIIKDIASRFSVVNADAIAKRDAAKFAARFAETFATKFYLLKQKSVDVQVFASLLNHVFKGIIEGKLPMEDDGKSLDGLKFRGILEDAAYRAGNLIDEVTRSGKVQGGEIDKHYAKYMVDTLFNKDGTRNDRRVTDLKTPMEVKASVANEESLRS